MRASGRESTTSAERGMLASPPSSRVVMWAWGLQSLGSAIKQHLLWEHTTIKGVAALLGGAQHKVGLAHQVQERQPLLHSQPTVLPGRESALGAQHQGTVEDAGVVADVGALEQGLVLGTQGGVVALLRYSPAATTARILLLGPHLGTALGALSAHAHVATAHTLLVRNGVAVLTGRGRRRGRGWVTHCSLPQKPCRQWKPTQV